MSQINGVGNSGNVGGVDSLGTCTSVNFLFAKLQMELASDAKASALNHIDQIKEAQAEQKEAADMLNILRDLKANATEEKGSAKMGTFTKGEAKKELAKVEGYVPDAKALQTQANQKTKANYKESGEYESTMMPKDMEQYFKDNKIDYASSGVSARQNGTEWQRAINSLESRKSALKVFAYMDDHKLAYSTGSSKDDFDVAIQSLQAYQESKGTGIQTQMVYVQDFMGQYNSYTQGANSAIQSGMQTLTSVARGQ